MTGHQYIQRSNGAVMDERLIGDCWIATLYGSLREHAPYLFRVCTQARMSALAAVMVFDLPGKIRGASVIRKMAMEMGVSFEECLETPASFVSARQLFERRIDYASFRPMPVREDVVVSPADARVLVGSLRETDLLFIKEKFFTTAELFGTQAARWMPVFGDGDFSIFRLTPDKYHYNHTPVSGVVVDVFEVDGCYHSCNPGAVMAFGAPYSKNKRVVTIMDTDVPGGTGVGKVAMIEVVALMIGRIEQCYSAGERYSDPIPVAPGLILKRGQPKSLYRPGSSTDILLFERGRIRFSADLEQNRRRTDVQSRFSIGLGQSAVETELRVREEIACRS
ncbi:MAG TPA: phosphatidylserine decarboxylase [Verrucomicrobia bacterium]|nr:phosphatidylserine decarboxylase [Verrucomicrobiota bacterium]